MTLEKSPQAQTVEKIDVLDVKISAINLDTARTAIMEALRSKAKGYVCVTGVHGVIEARSDLDFRRILNSAFLCTPDGMPMVWAGKLQGRRWVDRVYGPDLMLDICENTRNTPYTHFLYGGAEGVAEELKQKLEERFPGIRIVGTYTPPFRALNPEEETALANEFSRLKPSITWVGLSTPKQEKFMDAYLNKLDTTLMFGVGAAFDFHSGRVKQAPRFIQRSGFEWLYRVAQEPRRLWKRYLKNNTLFLGLIAKRRLTRLFGGRAEDGGGMRIAFLGSRGVPARYSGFEVVVEQLGSRLAERGHSVSVYNRYPRFDLPSGCYKGMRVYVLPTIPTKNLDTITHTALSALHALTKSYDVIYLCGVGNAIIGGFLRLLGLKVVINVDGADYSRAKWGSFARFWLHMSERWATKFAHCLIADNREIVARYQREYGSTPLYLSYGSIQRETKIEEGELARWNLQPRQYILFVSRLSPENQADLLLKAYARYKGPMKLVICGGANYEKAYYRQLQTLAGDRVIFTGPRYGDSYLELSQNALFFVMPADIEATRLVLLDQMGMGSAILYRDCLATREVVGDCAEAFETDDPEAALAAKIEYLTAHPDYCADLGRRALNRAKEHFSWDLVVNQYEELFAKLGVPALAAKKRAS